jgi:putative tryptophan/tyrosine transport system substrate-binding protein
MRRREFITALGGAATLPLGVRAQSSPRIVGFLHASTEKAFGRFAAAFRDGLKEGGFEDGSNIRIEYRWANNDYNRLQALASELVNHKVALIAAGGGTIGAQAAKRATDTIPIVFVSGGDPVKDGLVTSLNEPGGNATGVNQFASVLISKRFELLRELLPAGAPMGFLVNPDNPNGEIERRDLRHAAEITGTRLIVDTARSEGDLSQAIRALATKGAQGLIVGTDALFLGRRAQVVSLIQQSRLPASYSVREYTEAGGLMSYGANRADLWRQAGVYAGRVLNGERPATLPVLQPTRFELVVNAIAAEAIGFKLPPGFLARADEVIE